jgi:GntR family transcriptional repressor for pyruvate dehydrogenase complex
VYTGFRNITKKKVFVSVIEEIERAIGTGKLNPGDQLPSENEMVKLFNVSRPSVREALRAMEYAGIIETRGGKGNFIREHSHKNMVPKTTLQTMSRASSNEIIEARRFCEEYSLKVACDRITDIEKR